MEQTELESLIGDVEVAIDRLRSLYDQYFMGIERIEPGVARKDVDRKIYVLRREQIRNTALRFRFQMVLQRYNTFQSHWQRICREIENGTYKRHMLRAEQRFGRGAAKKASLAPPAASVAPSDAPPPAAGSSGIPAIPGSPGLPAMPGSPGLPAIPGSPPVPAFGRQPPPVPTAPLAGAQPAQPGSPPPLPGAARPAVPGGRFKPAPGAALPADLAAELAELDKDFAPAPAQDEALLTAARARQPQGPVPPAPPSGRDSLAPRPGKPPLPRPSGVAPPQPPPAAAPKPPAPLAPSAAKPPSIATQTPTAVRAPNATLLATMSPAAKAAAPAARPAAPPAANPTAPAAANPAVSVAKAPAQAPERTAPQTPTAVRPGVSVPTPLMAFPPPAQLPREALRPSPPPPPPAAPAHPSHPQPSAKVAPSPLPPRPPARPASVPVPRPPPKESSGDLTDHRVRQLYVEFVEAKRRQNESTAAITYETVAKSLRDSSERLRQRHGKPIDFEIAIRDGKAFLKPVLK